MRPTTSDLAPNARRLIKQESSNFIFDLPIGQSAGILLRGDDDVVSLGDAVLIETEELPEQAFRPISVNRITSLLADGDPQSRNAQPVVPNVQYKILSVATSPASICIDKSRPFQYPSMFRK